MAVADGGGEADHLAGERASAQFDVDGMKVAWDGSRHTVEVADRMARLVASDPQAPAFIFPFNQQQAAAVAAATSANRMGDTKSPGVSSAMPSSATAHASAPHPGAPAMNLSFANLQPADAQFLAILQNGYPFQVAAHAANSSQSYSSGNQHPVLLHGPAHRQDTNKRLQDGQSSDDKASHHQKGGYDHNFAVPVHLPNFALIPAAADNQSKKKSNDHHHNI